MEPALLWGRQERAPKLRDFSPNLPIFKFASPPPRRQKHAPHPLGPIEGPLVLPPIFCGGGSGGTLRKRESQEHASTHHKSGFHSLFFFFLSHAKKHAHSYDDLRGTVKI